MDGVIQLSGQRLSEFGRQQVCAGRAADDQGPAAEQSRRGLFSGFHEQERDMFRGVPGRCHHPDLERLRERLQEKPRTKAGQVRQAWPYIRELIAAGHTRKDIRTWLSDVGIEVGYKRLCDYIDRLRHTEQQAPSVATESTTTKHQEKASRRAVYQRVLALHDSEREISEKDE